MAANKSLRNGDVMVTSQVVQSGPNPWLCKWWCTRGVRARGWGGVRSDVMKGFEEGW